MRVRQAAGVALWPRLPMWPNFLSTLTVAFHVSCAKGRVGAFLFRVARGICDAHKFARTGRQGGAVDPLCSTYAPWRCS